MDGVTNPGPEWPAFFVDGCPPADAEDAHGVAFRIVRSDPPTLADFLAWITENPQGPRPETAPPAHGVSASIMACGTSISRELGLLTRKLTNLQKKNAAMRGRMIARGELETWMGRIKPTPSGPDSSHCSLWLRADADPSNKFAVVKP